VPVASRSCSSHQPPQRTPARGDCAEEASRRRDCLPELDTIVEDDSRGVADEPDPEMPTSKCTEDLSDGEAGEPLAETPPSKDLEDLWPLSPGSDPVIGKDAFREGLSHCSTEADMPMPRESSNSLATVFPCGSSEEVEGASDTEEAQQPPGRRSRRHTVARKSRRFAERVVRRCSSLTTAARRVPCVVVPSNMPPLFTQVLPKVTIPRLRDALERTDSCPLLRFLRDEMGCYDMRTTNWKSNGDEAGGLVRKSDYTMLVPRDIPETAARLLRIPEHITGTTIWHLRRDGPDLLVVQHSYTGDVLYGDRFQLQNTFSFRPEPEGGIVISTWTDVVWVSPLPWTHTVVRHVIERKAKADSVAVAAQLADIIQESAL